MTGLDDRAAEFGLTLSAQSRAEVEKNLALLAAMAAIVDAAQPDTDPPEFEL